MTAKTPPGCNAYAYLMTRVSGQANKMRLRIQQRHINNLEYSKPQKLSDELKLQDTLADYFELHRL